MAKMGMVKGLLDDHQHLEQHHSAANNVHQWQQPPFGYLKCNVNASFFNITGATGWEWFLRDHYGRFKLAGTNLVSSTLITLEGEAVAIIEAMEVMKQKGLSHVIFESDSKLVVNAISSNQEGLSEFSTLITHIKSLLRMNNCFEVKYVKRQTNKVAHSLARAANSMFSRCMFESIPRCIHTYLIIEMC
jgi:ribonuclease HI